LQSPWEATHWFRWKTTSPFIEGCSQGHMAEHNGISLHFSLQVRNWLNNRWYMDQLWGPVIWPPCSWSEPTWYLLMGNASKKIFYSTKLQDHDDMIILILVAGTDIRDSIWCCCEVWMQAGISSFEQFVKKFVELWSSPNYMVRCLLNVM
jgi:hypothetical protein